MNRDGVVDFNDAVLVDQFNGQSYTNLTQQLNATAPAPVTGVAQSIDLVDVQQIDGESQIGAGDVAVVNSALTGTGTTNWYGYNVRKTGTGTITWSRSAGAVNVSAGASFEVSAGTVNIGGGIDPFSDSNTAGPTVGNHLALIVDNGGAVNLTQNAQTLTLSNLAVGGGGNLDIANNTLLISYAAAANVSPDSAIRAALIAGSGTNGVSYNGVGIISSTAARLNAALVANGGTPKYGVGYADGSDPYLNNEGPAAGTEEVKLTLLGDLNLDGTVNSADFILFANSFGKTGGAAAAWDHGDLNYDGSVNSADFILFADNFGQSLGSVSSANGGLTLAQGGLDAEQVLQFNDIGTDLGISSAELATLDQKIAAVPEPGSLGFLSLGGLGLLARRRRRVRGWKTNVYDRG